MGIKVKTRQATSEDFKVGTTLIMTSGGWEFTLKRKYDEGIWECGRRVHFEDQARHYGVRV